MADQFWIVVRLPTETEALWGDDDGTVILDADWIVLHPTREAAEGVARAKVALSGGALAYAVLGVVEVVRG